MNNLEAFFNLEDIDIILQTIRLAFVILFSYYAYIKIINISKVKIKTMIIICISSILIAIIAKFMQYDVNTYLSIGILIFLMTISNVIAFKKDLVHSLVITIISFSISYILYIVAVAIMFFPNAIFKIQNDYINLIMIILIYSFFMYKFFKIKKIKNGMIFLQKKLPNSYFNILFLNIGIMIIFASVIIQIYGVIGTIQTGVTLTILAVIMLATIKESFDLYYKQNLLAKDLEQTKSELENTKKELEEANRDNIKISKKMHTLNHRQESLQYQLDKLTKLGNSNKDAKYLKEQLDSISEEMYQEPKEVQLTKTDIPGIDTMLDYMQFKCKENNIKFELQVEGNIHYMVNNLIPENDLEILLADHIKDAIIAINSSDNTNRSILVRLGKIDECHSLYIYDSGIEFTKEVLDKLGKEPITTHKDSGGTGMGFINTFNTLNKTKASLIIKEIGEPAIDNYTKVLIIKFDNEDQFKIESYKEQLEYSN